MGQLSPQASSEKKAWAKKREPIVKAFLERYARGLTTGDGRTIATMWDTPAFVLGDRSQLVVTSPEEVEKFFGGAREAYVERGIVGTRPEILRIQWLTERIVVADVRWSTFDSKGNAASAESSTYTLRMTSSGELKLCVAVIRDVEAAPDSSGAH